MQQERYTTADQARAWIQWAYEEQGGGVGSVFEMFSGRGEKQKETLRPSKVSAGLSATRVHAVESARQKEFKPPMSSGRSGGRVKRAIAELSPISQAWINYCYNPSRQSKRDAHRRLCILLWTKLRDDPCFRKCHADTLVTFQVMTRLQVQHCRTYFDFTLWEDKRPKEFASSIGRSSWSKTYRDPWKSIRSAIVNIDRQALETTYQKITQISH